MFHVIISRIYLYFLFVMDGNHHRLQTIFNPCVWFECPQHGIYNLVVHCYNLYVHSKYLSFVNKKNLQNLTFFFFLMLNGDFIVSTFVSFIYELFSVQLLLLYSVKSRSYSVMFYVHIHLMAWFYSFKYTKHTPFNKDPL